MFEDTLDHNLQLLLDGIDWAFLNEIVIKNKDCIVEFLKSDHLHVNSLNSCSDNIKRNMKGEEIADMIGTIRENFKKNIDNFKFVKYEKLPTRVRNIISSKEGYYSDMRHARNLLKTSVNLREVNNEGPNNYVTEERY